MQEAAISRRTVLGGAAVACGTVAASALGFEVPALAVGAAKHSPERMPRQREFERHIGRKFAVHTASGVRHVTLTSVDSLHMKHLPKGPRRLHPSGEQFALTFKGPASRAFAQGTYSMRTEGLRPVSLLIVPIGPHLGERAYECVIVNV